MVCFSNNKKHEEDDLNLNDNFLHESSCGVIYKIIITVFYY